MQCVDLKLKTSWADTLLATITQNDLLGSAPCSRTRATLARTQRNAADINRRMACVPVQVALETPSWKLDGLSSTLVEERHAAGRRERGQQ